MINSNERKLALSGWLQHHHKSEYSSPLKLQKFLFFYETISKIEGDDSDLSNLKGYQRGPVFSQVWGDYTKEKALFNEQSIKAYTEKSELVNNARALISSFIVRVFNESELSKITHELNIWKSKEPRIMGGEQQVPLSESDLDASDQSFIGTLKSAFSTQFIEECEVLEIGEKNFIISKEEAKGLSAEHYDTLYKLADKQGLENPVYLELDEEGALLVD